MSKTMIITFEDESDYDYVLATITEMEEEGDFGAGINVTYEDE